MATINIRRFFDSDTGKVLVEGLLNSYYDPSVVNKLLEGFGSNVTGRTVREIMRKTKVGEKIAKDVFEVGEKLFGFYCQKIIDGWTITDDMLLQTGIAHRSHSRAKILREVGRLNSIVFLREKLPLTLLLDTYIEIVLGLIYPPQAALYISKVTAQISPKKLYVLFSKKTTPKNVRYLGDTAILTLSRAIGILNITPLGKLLKKELL